MALIGVACGDDRPSSAGDADANRGDQTIDDAEIELDRTSGPPGGYILVQVPQCLELEGFPAPNIVLNEGPPPAEGLAITDPIAEAGLNSRGSGRIVIPEDATPGQYHVGVTCAIHTERNLPPLPRTDASTAPFEVVE